MDFLQLPTWPVYSSAVESKLLTLVRGGSVFDYSGKEPVLALEREFALLHDAAYVVSFNSGTSALFAALAAIGVGADDEVLVPNLTFLASASPLLWLGARPIFVDSSADEPSIDPDAIERVITSQTKAVIVTHLFGNPVDISAIVAICTAHGLPLVEDCSHAHASRIGSRHVGTFGDAAIYSIGAGKIVSGGHGGLLVTRNPTIRDIAMLIGHFKPRTRVDLITASLRPYAEFALGGNLRISPLAATLALDHLRSLEDLARARCANAAILDAALAGLLEPARSPAPRLNRSHFDYVYTLPTGTNASTRNELVDELRAAGIPVSAPSTRPLNRVLRAIAKSSKPSQNSYLRRLWELAQGAPRDDLVPYSVGQHDRMISFPARYLYHADTEVATWIGRKATQVVSGFLARQL